MSSNNTVQGAKFINAKPVYFPPMEYKWSNDDYGSGSYRSSVFHDKDGSVSGVSNSFIVINGGIVSDEGCEAKPAWNATVCKGDVGRMTIGAAAPGAGGGRGAGRGAGAGGPAGRGGAPGVAAGRGGAGAAPGAAPAGAGGRGPVVGARLGRIPEPAQPLAVLSRNGKEFPVTGATNVQAGTEYKVTTERPTLSLSVSELESGSWVIFELPGFTTAASGTAQDSVDALRKASATSYYKGNGSLWVKLVSSGDILGSGPNSGPSGGASLSVSRDAAAVTAAAR
jgi:cell migration-inducing and hyaluronan-binding protein